MLRLQRSLWSHGKPPPLPTALYDVIKVHPHACRWGTSNGDAYLESIKGDKDKMRELIRNERRLEMCFEKSALLRLAPLEGGTGQTERECPWHADRQAG